MSDARRVPPWKGRVAYRPTVRLSASCPVGQLVDAVGHAAAGRRFRVEVVAPGHLRVVRGMRGGDLLSEVVQLPLMTVLQRIEVEVTATQRPERAVLVATCTAGVRGLTVATKVSRFLDDAVRRLEHVGVPVQVEGWYASPDELEA